MLCWRQPGGVQEGFEKTRFVKKLGKVFRSCHSNIYCFSCRPVLNIHMEELVMTPQKEKK